MESNQLQFASEAMKKNVNQFLTKEQITQDVLHFINQYNENNFSSNENEEIFKILAEHELAANIINFLKNPTKENRAQLRGNCDRDTIEQLLTPLNLAFKRMAKTHMKFFADGLKFKKPFYLKDIEKTKKLISSVIEKINNTNPESLMKNECARTVYIILLRDKTITARIDFDFDLFYTIS